MKKVCVSPAELFKAAGLRPCKEPVRWGTHVPSREKGVYVIVRKKSLNGQCVLYVGRTRTSLRRRLSQFYRQVYGAPSPHRGGQEVIRFKRDLLVHWAVTNDPAFAENIMIERFKELVGRMPYANRIRASRSLKREPRQ